tara:strand:+ start:1910 stop:2710 length:801 start_codon:yes stop_codon:yes gene_type:complete
LTDLSLAFGIQRLTTTDASIQTDDLAHEALIRLQDANGTFVSLLGTPENLRSLFIGHCATEGYGEMNQAKLTTTTSKEHGYVVLSSDTLPNPPSTVNAERYVSTSCGACDSPGLEDLNNGLPTYLGEHRAVDLIILDAGFSAMKKMQVGFQTTGGMHGAGLLMPNTGLTYVAEDIGRHNAVDKVVGMALVNRTIEAKTILLLSGRCGWDIVAKSARAGIGTIACVGACSSLAAETARALGIRIFSFVKPSSCVAIGAIGASPNGKP